MKIRKIPISKINSAPYNPRKDLQPEDPEYQHLLKSIDEFGYIDPVVYNGRTGNLVGGHLFSDNSKFIRRHLKIPYSKYL